MYAIVRNGGRQTKVAVGDVIEIDKLDCTPGESLSLAAVLVVDGDDVTTDLTRSPRSTSRPRWSARPRARRSTS